jgi:hypothetical protein
MDERDGGTDEREREREKERERERERDRDRGDLPESLRQRLEALVPEMVKRTFAAGLGAVFSTEEGIRKIAKEINLPDVAGYLASTADTTKDKVVEIIAVQVREFLETINLGEEIAKLLTTLSFEIKTEIRFIPNDAKFTGVDPDVRAAVRLKRAETKADKSDKDKADKADKAAEKDRNGETTERRRARLWRRDDPAEIVEDEDDDEPPIDE